MQAKFDKEKTDSLEKLCREIKSLPDSPATLINIEHPERNLTQIIELTKHGEKRDNYRDSILNDFNKGILKYDAEQNLTRWNTVSQKWFLPKLLGQNKILKTLQPLSKTGKVEKSKVIEYFETLILHQKEQELLDEDATTLSNSLDFLWNNGNCKWATVSQICETSLQINRILIIITKDSLKTKEIKYNLANLLYDGGRSFLDVKGKTILSYVALAEEQQKIEKNLFDLLNINFNLEQNNLIDWTEFWKQNAESWLANLDSLRDWTSWNRIKDEIIENGISSVVEAYSNGKLKNQEVLASFKKSLFKHFSEYIISKDTRLSVLLVNYLKVKSGNSRSKVNILKN